jgi:predicted nucleotidyltransferase
MNLGHLEIDQDTLADFCRRWHITELALFGSVLRDDFKPTSDIDVLVTFASDAEITLFDFVHMQNELSAILDRKVDLVESEAVKRSNNLIRRNAILTSARAIYVA